MPGCCDCAQHDGGGFLLRYCAHSFTLSLRMFLYLVIALAFLLRHSARSRGIQSMRVKLFLILDAATASSMTGGSVEGGNY